MKVPVSHRVVFLSGPTTGTLVAVAQVVDENGIVVANGPEVPVTAGSSLAFGTVVLDVGYPGDFTEGTSPVTPKTGPPADAHKPTGLGGQPPPRR